jgi:hypothetical protein
MIETAKFVAVLRFVLRRIAGSAAEALETLGKKEQQAQHVNGYFQRRFIWNL